MSLFDPDFFDKSKYIESLFTTTMSSPQVSLYEKHYQELVNYAYDYKSHSIPKHLPPEFEILTSKKNNKIYFRRCYKKCVWQTHTYQQDDSIWPEQLYDYLMKLPYNPFLVHITWPHNN
jgi:hypothetical protein